ncbi:MAG TPA: hypothetical protein VGN88_00075 [Phycisphaerae bacterium]|jgi:hypothetical protein
MRFTDVAFLAAFISVTHGECHYVRTACVRQVVENEELWMEEVAIFRLPDHECGECYAWISDGEFSMSEPHVFLRSDEIDSAAAAVRFYVRDLSRNLAA